MAEALFAIGVVANVAQLAHIGWTVVKRINEYQTTTKGTPGIYQEIATQLPQVINICNNVKDEHLSFSSSPAFRQIVDACLAHVTTLEDLLSKALPTKTDSKITRARKAVASVRLEKRLAELQRILESYKSSLTLELGQQTVESLRSPIPTLGVPVKSTFYSIPSSQVSRFIGRETLLNDLAETLSAETSNSGQNVAVLLGMGGQGKTQLALEYCRRSKKSSKYKSILWINTNSPASVARSFEEIADLMTKSKRQYKDTAACVTFVKETLDRWFTPSLMVFDNFDHPSQMKNIKDYYPTTIGAGIIFTTRNRDCDRLGTCIQVSAMEENEAIDLLLHQTQRLLSKEHIEEARPIVRKLGFLPLAIDQAGAYINARRLPLNSFIDHYENRKEFVMKHTPELWDYRRKLNDEEEETSLSVFSTWELSFREISGGEDEISSITHFLTLSAFFPNVHSSEEILRAHFVAHNTISGWMKIFTTDNEFDRYKYEDVIADLARLSLLHHETSDKQAVRISLHPLVRDWIQLRISHKERQNYTIEAMHCISDHIEAKTSAMELSVEVSRNILSFIDVCCENRAKYLNRCGTIPLSLYRESLSTFAKFYNRQGRYNDAELLFKDILADDETQYGLNDPSALETRFHVCEVYYNQGRYTEARELLLRIQSEQEKQFGQHDHRSLNTITVLARVDYREASYDEAVDHYQKALEGYQRDPHPEHPEVFRIYEELAMVLRNQGDHDAAVILYNKALSGFEQIYGANSPHGLKAMVHLADTYRNQTLYEKSLVLYKNALACNETLFGPDHLNTLENMVNLAINLRNLGHYTDSEEMFVTALHGIEKIVGENHPDTLRTLMNLAINHHKLGNYSKAEPLYVVILERRERVLGLDHHYTWRTVECLCDLYWIQDRCEEAEKLAKRAMRGGRRSSVNNIKSLPRRPPDRSPERNPARMKAPRHQSEPLIHEKSKYPNLEALFLRALHRDQTSLRGYHADKLDTMTSLAHVYVGQGRYDEARELFDEVMAVLKKRFGITHRDFARVLLALSDLNQLQGYGEGTDSLYDSGFEEDEGAGALEDLKI